MRVKSIKYIIHITRYYSLVRSKFPSVKIIRNTDISSE